MTTKATDLIVPVTTPYVLAVVNILCPGLGTMIAACVNPEGFNGRLLGLGFLIHFLFILSFVSYPVLMAIACVFVFFEITMFCCCTFFHLGLQLIIFTLAWLPCLSVPLTYANIMAAPLGVI